MRGATQTFPDIVRPGRAEYAVGILLVVQIVVLLAYLGIRDPILTSPSRIAIPFLWINLGVWGALRVSAPRNGRRGVAALVAIGYVAFLFAAAGIVGAGSHHSGANVYWLLPGWGPIVTVQSELLILRIVPYQVLGYLALGYLVFVTVARTAAGALTGVVGAFSCIGCAFPLVATVLGGIGGTTSATVSGMSDVSVLGTGIFVATVLLLVFVDHLASTK